MSYDYSENILVQESAGNFLRDELGWDVKFAYNTEVLGKNGSFGRESYKDILLTRYFYEALRKFNPWINENQIIEAQQVLENILSTSSLLQVNEEKYFLIRDGIPVTVKKPNGQTKTKKAIVIDFKNPDSNYFLAIKELKIHGDLYRRRTDIVGFINGIPLLFVELKKNTVDVQNAYEDNYTDYLDTIPHLFYYNAFLMLSNGTEAKVGTLGSKFEFFQEWKRLAEEDQGSVALETMLRGICKKENFLDLFENFILFDHSDGHTAKILARNHQYLGVNEAMKAYSARKLNDGKLGVFWHTQGSGKSYSMVFFAKKVRRKMEGTPTFVILTDRDELNTQISDTFENCGLLGKDIKASQFIATSGDDLLKKLQGNPSFIFTLIQKFNKPNEKPIYPDHDIIIMSDEAHRSQYGIFADNMMKLLPTAARIGFTGTPLLSSDNITARTFGGYVSVYDFKRAVEDGATVPLYYENRGEKIVDLHNPEITNQILDAIENADLDVDQQDKLEAEFAKEIHLLTAEPRLKSIAQDFVRHYSDLWASGKAMFVCLNKVTCVRMYNYVQEYWKAEIKTLKLSLKYASQQESIELERKIKWMQETEMAVVISQEQNEIQTFKKWGLDIKTHRSKMEKRDLDKEFKDSKNPLRIVFVCAMWLTGFDVKCLSCLYLDKPLKSHTLMQAIARANRVSEGKSNGLIIDYIGIVKALRKALADYTANVSGNEGSDPTIDKDELIVRIIETIGKADEFLNENNFDLEMLINAYDFMKLSYLQEAANAVCGSIEDKKTFTTYASELNRLMKYTDRDDITGHARKKYEAISAIYAELQKKRKHINTTDLMIEINEIISEYVEIEHPPTMVREQPRRFDISSIDFDLLRKEFSKVKKKNLVLNDLEEVIQHKLDSMLFANPDRINYYERYQQIIDDYNSEKDRATIENTFMELMDLANQMSQEEQRYVREGFTSDEELSLYDMLFRDDLSKTDIKKLKEVAASLLQKIKMKIAEFDHWTDKQETKAAIDNIIRDTLWAELPECYDEVSISMYRQQIYEYVYTRYRTIA
ncbi:MAG: type I restriction endonuclease subunit R [Finegoldia magna]|uniref:type I restriction endonuclease subunit R n=1 Tax=Finegoldia magna TaxID=1260 RepID=UPI0026EF2F97|nr:type I restriction endonuclease subunit R [Finegoldia magna]MBS5776083.1 type I restriction endonuclease subunit R [Finegoldia magna]MDU2574941.1 type I restriction endonuclease subunit R [Finegoldia magna]MDU5223697.1 type I restriction endonuclease subunit R [Finegoldia magna]MDU7478925.1 type I restriction endonuclease subunit R [Finegoldia magna]